MTPCEWNMFSALKPSVLWNLVGTKIRNLGSKPCPMFMLYKQRSLHPFMSCGFAKVPAPHYCPAWCTAVTWQQLTSTRGCTVYETTNVLRFQ